MDLSIIIVSYNTKSLLRDCIVSIMNAISNHRYEIIIIDNDSSDGSQKMLKTEFSDCILIENKSNLGFGKANNQGMKIAKGRFILLLNSDTIVSQGALSAMIEFIEKHETIGMLGPRLLNEDGTTQPSVSSYPNLWYVILRMLRLRKIIPMKLLKKLVLKYRIFGSTIQSYFQSESVNPVETDFVSGACMLVRSHVVDKVGMFDENFFMYLEDFDLCKRIRASGWGIWYYPIADVVHLGGRSSDGFRDMSPISYDSLYYYFRKHHGRLQELAARIIVVVAMIGRTCADIITKPKDTIIGNNKIYKNYVKIIKNTVS